MTFRLERFQIDGLYGYKKIDIHFNKKKGGENKLILVGENGTGKTTIVNLIFFVLTRQWQKIANYNFKTITLTISGEKIFIEKSNLLKDSRDVKKLIELPPSIKKRLEKIFSEYRLNENEILSNSDILNRVSNEVGMPISILFEYLIESSSDFTIKTIDEAEQSLSKLIGDENQILYLPTYRRIEKDLRYIFPDIDESNPRPRRSRYPRRNHGAYIELVEFGMKDVDEAIEQTLQDLKDNLRRELNELNATYLKDVIRGNYKDIDIESLLNLDIVIVDSVLDRISDNKLLSDSDKSTLRAMLNRVKENKVIHDEDRVLAHFFVRLIELHRNQQKNETSIKKFVEVCNRYLINKRIEFDSAKLQIQISQNLDNNIQMQMLSSGEKQIVSLFAHLYFYEKPEIFVIIDEPELSLSVPWQRQFLPDILATDKCAGLIAVTHSPFIFDNELDKYAHDISEFWK